MRKATLNRSCLLRRARQRESLVSESEEVGGTEGTEVGGFNPKFNYLPVL